MTSARNNILSKLKSQVKDADYSKLPAEQGFNYPQQSFSEQLEQFITHLENNHAQIIKLTRAEIGKVITQELAARNITSLLYGDNSQYTQDIEQSDSSITLNKYSFDFAQHKERLFNDTPAGVTGSRCAIAQTGSIVLWPTPDEPRTLSLVPPVHFVIVDAKTLYPSFGDLIEQQQWADKLPTNAVLVSGPSKTADIQQTLAYGAHGPKELIVLLLNS